MNKILFSMVTSVNRWLSVSVLGYFLVVPAFIGEKAIHSQRKMTLHPFHVSTTEINHNKADKSLEISCRLFLDDFESCLSKQYHTKADLSAPNVKVSMDSLVKKYLIDHLQIKADDKPVVLNYIGFEKENEAANVYFEADDIVSVKKVDVTSSILQDMYDDQINIIHVIVGGNRKSTKLDYPDKLASFSF